MHSPDDYRILVSAGTDYDTATHVPVRVNAAKPLRLQGPGGDVWLNVRIKNYRGPEGHPEVGEQPDPETSPYFEQEPHKANDDTYGIGVWFVPKKEAGEDKNDDDDDNNSDGITGTDLQWGNNFDEPLRDRLPPGFSAALRIVKWWIDPGLEGDPYADKPYLYGPALSSFNRVYAALGDKPPSEQSEDGSEDDEDEGDSTKRSEKKKNGKSKHSEDSKDNKSEDHTQPPTRDDCGLWFDEGGDAGGRAWRESIGAPGADVDATTGESTGNGKARMKWALGADAKAAWRWRYGQGYGLDFYNGYLDFADLTLRLPGFHLPLLRYYASDKADKTCLRYVLRHRGTGQVYLVVVFRLVKITKGDDDNNDAEGNEVEGDGENDEDDPEAGDDKIIEAARRKLSAQDINTDNAPDINADDVD